ncbi:hypothetical protein JTE90_026954 [Oedothorax gibbosus]|uniref:Uncharacterized protein n=1 Tax=Oedothorax gibbosus TaxID=931172 RepID=A0AAV6UVG6_9ARAC|nr:hypothetical protein JTE90_026954 [Oedothorax gibbosus]
MKFWSSAAILATFIATSVHAQGHFPMFGGGGQIPMSIGGGFGGGAHPGFGGGGFGGSPMQIYGGGSFGGGAFEGGMPFASAGGHMSSFGQGGPIPAQFGGFGGGPAGFAPPPSYGSPAPSHGGGGSSGSGGYTLQGLGSLGEGALGGFSIGGRSLASLLQNLSIGRR